MTTEDQSPFLPPQDEPIAAPADTTTDETEYELKKLCDACDYLFEVEEHVFLAVMKHNGLTDEDEMTKGEINSMIKAFLNTETVY